jgi:hypothetical protein
MPLQTPQLDDRDFAQLVAEATSRIPVHTPEWNNFNDSDPGMTLVQVFAFMTENLLYRSNRIPEANRLKFLSLLGIGLQPASAGRGLIVVRNERGPVQATELRKGAEVLAGNVRFRTRSDINILPVSMQVYYKKPQTDLDEATRQQYTELYETFLEEGADQLVFYETLPLEPPEVGKPLPNLDLSDRVQGTIDGSLWLALIAREGGDPARAVDEARRAIAEQTLALGIYPTNQRNGDILPPKTSEVRQVDDPRLVFEIAAPESTSAGTLAPPRYKRLTIEYAEDVLDMPGIVQLTLPRYEDLALWDFDPTEEGTKDYPPRLEDRDLANRVVTWLRIRLPEDEQADASSATVQQQAVLSWVGINAARVIQTILVEHERLGTASGAPNQTYKVVNTPVIVPPPGATAPERDVVLQVKNESGEFQTWERTDDLFAAGPDDEVYMLDPEAGQVRFGSGLRGKRPGFGQEIRISYEYGGGPEGNVNIGAINKSPELPGGFKLRNPVPTWGASRGETTAEGEQSISSFLQHRDRLVTAEDFRLITERTPGVNIGRVEVLPLFNPHEFHPGGDPQSWPGALTVLVVPGHDIEQTTPPVPDRLFLDAICRWLDPRRLVTTEVFVRGPDYVQLVVSVGIVTMSGHVRAIVHRDVQAALREYLSPLLGGPQTSTEDPTAAPQGTGWPLGMEVRSRDLEAVAVRVPGVRYVNNVQVGVLNKTTVQKTDNIHMEGIQLPWLDAISVREGDPEEVGALVGQTPDETPGKRVHVPVVPRTCY